MKCYIHSHRFGNLIISKSVLETITSAIEQTQTKVEKGNSKIIKDCILEKLLSKGWSDEVVISSQSGITITSLKEKTGLCFQTGNMGRMYADLIKLQALYLKETIKAGILIVPTSNCAKILGSNIANYERLKLELDIFERVISVPSVIFGLE